MRTLVALCTALTATVALNTAQCRELNEDEVNRLFQGTVVRSAMTSEGLVAMQVNRPDGTTTMWWGFPQDPETYQGSWRIQKDEYCRSWGNRPERCARIWQIGPDSYEMWGKDGFGDDLVFNRFHVLLRK